MKTSTLAAALACIAASGAPKPSQGTLYTIDRGGNLQAECPLKHTSVQAEISGPLSRVTVTQEFVNNAQDKVEAVYVFPLPHDSAVDEMTMLVGKRVIHSRIKRREEARAIYDAARQSGRLAGLLDQERPNIFTQAVANIRPGESVKVKIRYVETLSYEAGEYRFSFPMVVGPRYIPGAPMGRSGGGWGPDTTVVPDGSRITPPVAVPGTRAGHDIDLQVTLAAGLPVESILSTTHDVTVDKGSTGKAVIRLRDQQTIPNKDFDLRYDVAGRKIQDALLVHNGAQGGYFTFLLQPPERVTSQEVTPKELVFVLDTSGSMHGFPLEKAKEAMDQAIAGLHPRDTFNLITFAGDTHILFPAPVSATPENLQRAHQFLAGRTGGGGTEMMKAIRAALDGASSDHVRVVCFMTDGYVGNEAEIIAEVQKHPEARVFSFGIGSSVNRYLLDKMAEYGRGEVEYVSLSDDGSAAAKKFHERVRSPLMTDISLDWSGLPVNDVLPARIPDLFSAKPLVITGRFSGEAKGVLRVRGRMNGRDVVREIAVRLPASHPEHGVLATLWARSKVDQIMHQALGPYEGRNGEDREQITQLGLKYSLMTPYTSFVAVEEGVETSGGAPRRVEVPVEMPHGVSYQGVFGLSADAAELRAAAPSAAVGRRMSVNSATLVDRALVKAQEPKAQVRTGKVHPSLKGRTGILEVRVTVVNTSTAVMDELKKAGLDITGRPDATTLVGKIDASKLEALSRLGIVVQIAPVK